MDGAGVLARGVSVPGPFYGILTIRSAGNSASSGALNRSRGRRLLIQLRRVVSEPPGLGLRTEEGSSTRLPGRRGERVVIYRLRNVTTGAERLCGTEQEAHETVIDIVSGREEWVIDIPQQSGVTFTVSRGVGRVPYGPLLARLLTGRAQAGAPLATVPHTACRGRSDGHLFREEHDHGRQASVRNRGGSPPEGERDTLRR